MAGNSSEPTRRKHHRSIDDELEETSKRRKHRHHRHHRHSTRKHGEERDFKRDEEVLIEERRKPVEEVAAVAAHPPPLLPGSYSKPDSDMEEGEIVDDEGCVGEDVILVRKRTDSDAESGEIKADEIRGQSEQFNTGVSDADGLGKGESDVSKIPCKKRSDEKLYIVALPEENCKSDGSLSNNEIDLLENSTSEPCIDAEQKCFKESYRPPRVPRSPSKGSRKQKKFHDNDIDSKVKEKSRQGSRKRESYDDEDIDLRDEVKPGKGGRMMENYDDGGMDQGKSFSRQSNGDSDRNVAPSPSRGGNREEVEVHSRNRSKSRDRANERSGSRSILEEAPYVTSKGQKHVPKRPLSDSDDDKVVGRHGKYSHDSRGATKDKARGRSSSYSRHETPVDRHHSREFDGMERERDRETRSKDMEGKENTDGRRERKRGRDSDLVKERDRARERDMDIKEKSRGRERDKERVRDRAWEERDREREGEREGEREDRGRERQKDKDREREGRESRRDRSRDREKQEINNGSRYSYRDKKYDDSYDDRDRYYESKRRRHNDLDKQDRSRKYERETLDNARTDTLHKDDEKSKRDEAEQEEYPDRIPLQVGDQEEEDLNRIKEESRRRRQAILDKYTSQQKQQQKEQNVDDEGKEHNKEASRVVVTIAAAPKTIDAKTVDVPERSFTVGNSPVQNGGSALERASGNGGLGEGTPKSERSSDMFCDDIFGESPAGVRRTGKGDGVAIERSGLHDNWDDAEGYYSYRFGEILDSRYEVTAAHGKGVFSTVVRAKDLKAGSGDPEEVAIKIIRNNETMHKAGKEELIILKKLVGADPENKRHCVRFLSSFKYRNHLCLVFESLHMNLREVLKKFGRNIGLKLTAVRAYAKQLFIALKHLRNCGVLHCDIKPDNMLVNEAKNVLKLCDFGNAMFAGKNEITPYLVSRFYRAPEIILGLAYDHPMDIWSVGCCLFELYTGKVLFPGATNNDMLRLHMELKGSFPKKMLRKGAFTEQHFDQDLNFLATEEDPVTKKTMRKLITSIKPKDLGALVTGSPGEDPKMLVNFKDLLEKTFLLDPEKRITVSQALSHPFITGK